LKKTDPTSIGDDELFQRDSKGTVCDRTALFACAFADPELLDLWQDISRPIESDARPGEPIPSLTPCHALPLFNTPSQSHIVTSVVQTHYFDNQQRHYDCVHLYNTLSAEVLLCIHLSDVDRQMLEGTFGML
jgi:hypothetical protein